MHFRRSFTFPCAIALCAGFAVSQAHAAPPPPAHSAMLPAGAHSSPHSLQRPLCFEANRGQTDPHVKFLARGNGYTLFLTGKEAVLRLHNAKKASVHSVSDAVLRLKLAGANASASVAGMAPSPTVTNYVRGRDPRRWNLNVPAFSRVRYSSVYPGIDLVYYGVHRQLEYDFVVAPGASAGRIQLQFEGARGIHLEKSGDLKLTLAGGDVVWKRPTVYQERAGQRCEVHGAYTVCQQGKNATVGFRIAAYDRTLPLVIDPVLHYSTFLGGSGFDQVQAIASDNARDAYVTGQTTSYDFPVTGAAQPNYGGNTDAFVAKLTPAGAFAYVTYLGGSGTDYGNGIAVDSLGAAYVTGGTYSKDFPVTKYGYQTISRTQNQAAFVAKLAPNGSLAYATYLGGNWQDEGSGIAVDATGSAYVTGFSGSYDFPTTPGAYQRDRGFINWRYAFVAKLNPAGTNLTYSTLIHGRGTSYGNAIAVDSAGNALIGGTTVARDFPTTSGVLQNTKAGATFLISSDGGNTLTPSEQGLPATEIDGIALDPNNASTLYTWGDLGVNKSTDGGATWRFANVNPFINKLKVDPSNSNILWIAYFNGVYKSTDAGNSWNYNVGLTADCRDITVDPTNSSTVYVAAIQGVFKSVNGGITWTKMISGLPLDSNSNPLCYAFAIDPKTPSTLYLGTNFGAFKSTNGGKTWAGINVGMPKTYGHPYGIDQIAIHPKQPSVLLARTLLNNTLIRSANGGASWKLTSFGSANGSAMDPNNPSILYAASWWGIAKSIDRGINWEWHITPLPYANFNTLAVSPTDPRKIYAGAFIAWDGYVTKLNQAGSSLVYSTYIGGSAYDWLQGVAVDSAGNTFVVGSTRSEDFPVVNPYQPVLTGFQNGFIAKFDPNGGPLFSTYFGSSNYDATNALALDPQGNPVVVGSTDSIDFPTAGNSLQTDTVGRPDGYLLKMKADGSDLIYSTYLSGSGYDDAWAVATNRAGDIFVAGQTSSPDFPTVNATFPTLKPNADAFITAFTDRAPVALTSISFTPTSVPGSAAATGKVTLSGAAPYDLLLWLTTDSPVAYVQRFLTVPKGASSQTFPVYTQGVSSPVVTLVSAGFDTTKSANLTVRPVALQSLAASASSVQGGAKFDLTATLEIVAPFGTSVQLFSDNLNLVPVPTTLFVPGGSSTGKITITTGTISGNTPVTVTLTAVAGGVTKTVKVTITR